MTEFEHRPVMVDEVVDLLRPVPAGLVVDATVGAGGHSAAILSVRPELSVLGIDRDEDALAAAAATLAPFESRVTLRQIRFDALAATMEELGVDQLAGGLFDLGVSSPQFDRADRGFSYRFEGPLDMRMDRRQTRTAADIVNDDDEQALAGVLRDYGDERYARRIAAAIVAARPLRTTTELASVVRDAIPAPARRRGGHPAKRTFQALRIAVNDELDALPAALDQVIDRLLPGGRCVAISYHSGEDRIVKDRFRIATGACDCPPGLPCVCDAVQTVRLVRGIPRRPSTAEREANPRAASARLRVAERIEPLTGDAKDGR
jgi:16S rRNA (cytosine1402-N4)-methyltransferase